ncbi:MAG: hypothetical protein ABMA64_17920 [Myxococcota bacterium]
MVIALLAGCPHRLTDLPEPRACAVARAEPSRDAWAAAYWADPEGGCAEEALVGLRLPRVAPDEGAAPPSDGVLVGSGRMTRAVADLLATVTPDADRVEIVNSDGSTVEGSLAAELDGLRVRIARCVDGSTTGRARVVGAIGPTGAVRVGALTGDPAIGACVGPALDEAVLPPDLVPRPLDVTVRVARRPGG